MWSGIRNLLLSLSLAILIIPQNISGELRYEFERLYYRAPVPTPTPAPTTSRISPQPLTPTPMPVEPSVTQVAQLHFELPLTRNLISGWTYLDVRKPEHTGIDYGCVEGDPVFSTADGTVIWAGWNGDCGNEVAVRHTAGYITYYCHLSKFGSRGNVSQGAIIGYCGNTGASTGPHLHYEVHRYDTPVDPCGLP